MRIVKSVQELEELHGRANAVVLGNFDGVHLGHRHLICRSVEDSKRFGWSSAVLTFDPHPTTIVSSDKQVSLINTAEQKYEMIKALGVDNLIVLPFDTDLAATGPEDFVRKYLVGMLSVSSVYVGFDYSFGQHASGTPETLKLLGDKYGFRVLVALPVLVEGEIVSSSLIRQKYAEGRMAQAAKLLGYWPFLEGKVVPGEQRGRRLGFPTANIEIAERQLLPSLGVYAAMVELKTKRRTAPLPAVVNIGFKPTFAAAKVMIETHLLDFSRELYGETLRINLHDKLREERHFETISELQKQIERDVATARERLAGGLGSLIETSPEKSISGD